MPFVIALADFHKSLLESELGPMTDTQSALRQYLYGFISYPETVDGKVIITNRDLKTHTYKGKTIASNFFNLPDAENVSAVIFSNSATIGKFQRIGVLAGYTDPKYRYGRMGILYNSKTFSYTKFSKETGAEDYSEGWADELHIFHNPRALRPLPKECFGFLNQYFFEDGQLVLYGASQYILSSFTYFFQRGDDEESKSRPY